ncbi:MAG TPA: CheR family methyltransferase [Polyangiales bacterium]|nr:CheR family methyltransferase [Polyangiales bacterium]
MSDARCDELLAWALPQLGLRWAGFRRVKRQVCRRVRARIAELALADERAYRAFLASHPGEWPVLEAMCGITISRFYRDRAVFDCLRQRVLPALVRRAADPLRVWSAGCASGEEPYTIALIWELELAVSRPGLAFQVLATDSNPRLLERAAHACYRHSSLRELPREWIARSFTQRGDAWCLDPSLRRSVTLETQDLRRTLPPGQFQLILCRNLAFSYFDAAEQRRVLDGMIERLSPGGHLVLGQREQLPEPSELVRLAECELIYRRAD